MAEQDFTDVAWVASGAGVAKTSATLITYTAVVRNAVARVGRDEGAGAIVDGFDYTQYFEWSNATIDEQESIIPFAVSQVDKQMRPAFDAGDKTIYSHIIQSTNLLLRVQHITGVASEDANTVIHNSFVPQNLYKVRVTRSGASVVALLYDVDGGEGVAGALVATIPLTITTEEAYQYLFAANNLDNGGTSVVSATFGPLYIGPEVPVVDDTMFKSPVRAPIPTTLFRSVRRA